MDFGVVLWKEKKDPQVEELKHWLEAEGFSVMRWSDPPGASYEPHSHGHDESIWVYQGQIEFIVGEQHYPLKAGDRLFFCHAIPCTPPRCRTAQRPATSSGKNDFALHGRLFIVLLASCQ